MPERTNVLPARSGEHLGEDHVPHVGEPNLGSYASSLMRKTYEIQGKPDEPVLALLVALLERCPCVGCAYEPENAYLDRPLCFQSLVY
jgi:hypothetical protein